LGFFHRKTDFFCPEQTNGRLGQMAGRPIH